MITKLDVEDLGFAIQRYYKLVQDVEVTTRHKGGELVYAELEVGADEADKWSAHVEVEFCDCCEPHVHVNFWTGPEEGYEVAYCEKTRDILPGTIIDAIDGFLVSKGVLP